MKTDNGTIDDPVQIAEPLNTMFVNVASRLNVNNIQDVVNEKLRYFVTSRLTADVEPFNIPQITEKDILEFINKLPTNKSTGHDKCVENCANCTVAQRWTQRSVMSIIIDPLQSCLRFPRFLKYTKRSHLQTI